MKESFFQLEEQSIVKVEFIKNETYKSKNIKLEYNTKIKREKINDNSEYVTITLNVFKKKEIKLAPFYINVEVKGKFVWNEIEDKKILDSLLNQNAPAVLLPNIRMIISQLTTFSGYPPLIIPLINFSE